MTPTYPAMQISVIHQPLKADECEQLKIDVADREKDFTWGTYGPDFRQPLSEHSIADLSTQHLENILITQRQLTNEHAAAILMLLKKRYS